MRFFRRSGVKPTQAYDPEKLKPAMRCSICTGEQVAGFRELDTGRFRDVMLIRTPQDLADFCQSYGADPANIEKFY